MPFTPSHILAVVPIAAAAPEALPLSALAIGSMIPDLPLFVPIAPGYETTHSVAGVFTVCLPLGIAAFLTFQYIMKRPLLALAPDAIRRRCTSTIGVPAWWTARRLIGLSLAIIIGALTHIVWDAFTHRDRWGTELIPSLRAPAITLFGRQLSGYEILQHTSSVFGLAALAPLGAWWCVRQDPRNVHDFKPAPLAIKWTACAILCLVPLALGAWVIWRFGDYSLLTQVGWWIRASGLALMIGAITYCIAFHVMSLGHPGKRG